MSTVKAFIRTSKKDKETNVRFRISDGRKIQIFHKSDFKIMPSLWDDKKEQIKTRSIIDIEKRRSFDDNIIERKKLLIEIYDNEKNVTSENIDDLVESYLHPTLETKEKTYFDYWELYLKKQDFSKARERDMNVLIRMLERYEIFKKATTRGGFTLSLDKFTSDILLDFKNYLDNEYLLVEKYNTIYSQIEIDRPIVQRGENTVITIIKRLRSFCNFTVKQGYTTNYPFNKFKVGNEMYGTPIYISLAERNKIADCNLSSKPHLEIQRDIFIFQCLIGCRVSDLLQFTISNLIDEAIEYIPAKTLEDRVDVIRVPLNARAKDLINKYKGREDKRLFPFISAQKYNDAIKLIFKAAGITRMVTVINTKTGRPEQKPINEIASSHMARRTFVGNLYKQVKDPNLVGSLSGHKEGSKAFARYRDIDEDIKKELVNLID